MLELIVLPSAGFSQMHATKLQMLVHYFIRMIRVATVKRPRCKDPPQAYFEDVCHGTEENVFGSCDEIVLLVSGVCSFSFHFRGIQLNAIQWAIRMFFVTGKSVLHALTCSLLARLSSSRASAAFVVSNIDCNWQFVWTWTWTRFSPFATEHKSFIGLVRHTCLRPFQEKRCMIQVTQTL